MTRKKISALCMAALFAALTCVTTLLIQIPMPLGGYINLGDCFVLLGAWLLGPWYAAAAGAVGAALADVFSGYVFYAPATLLIKGAVAVTAAVTARAVAGKGHRRLAPAVSASVAEIIMVTGYYLYEALVMGFGFAGAALNLPASLFQGTAGAISACVLMPLLRGIKSHWDSQSNIL